MKEEEKKKKGKCGSLPPADPSGPVEKYSQYIKVITSYSFFASHASELNLLYTDIYSFFESLFWEYQITKFNYKKEMKIHIEMKSFVQLGPTGQLSSSFGPKQYTSFNFLSTHLPTTHPHPHKLFEGFYALHKAKIWYVGFIKVNQQYHKVLPPPPPPHHL